MRQSCTAVAEGQTRGEHSTWVGGDVILLTRSPGALDAAEMDGFLALMKII